MIGETKLKILIAALTPSRYTDLAKSSGVSKTMFDRHIDDLIEEGLIEKTENGLYIITTKGIELLLKLKASEQQKIFDDIKNVLTPKKKISEEAKHCLVEIGRLYSEYLLQITEIFLVKSRFQKFIENVMGKDYLGEFIADLENLIGSSFSLTIYIIAKLRDLTGKNSAPIIENLKRILSLKHEALTPISLKDIDRVLNAAKDKLDLLLNEVNHLSKISEKDEDLKVMVSYLRLRLESLNNYMKKIIDYLTLYE